jgi:hypothetical protein
MVATERKRKICEPTASKKKASEKLEKLNQAKEKLRQYKEKSKKCKNKRTVHYGKTHHTRILVRTKEP